MNSQSFEQARQYVLQRLETELPSNLYYHGIHHTRDEVVPAVKLLAGLEGIKGESLALLQTAAWFHDIGYVEQPTFHELISARIAVNTLPEFGFDKKQIEEIRWIIMATILPQSPNNTLERIMTDADLSVLGADNFMPRNLDLRRELATFGKIYSNVEWYTGQISFTENHTFFTASAQSLWNTKKAANINVLRNELKYLMAD